MKYRIIEFKSNKPEERFFVETGTLIFEKTIFNIPIPKIVWEKDIINDEIKGYSKYSDAIKRVIEIKESQPIIHNIK